MLDIKLLRMNLNDVKEKLKSRGFDASLLDQFPELDKLRGELIIEVETLKAKRNETSKQIGLLKRNGEDVSNIMAEVARIGDRISEIDPLLSGIDEKIGEIISWLPNLPQPVTPIGLSEEENIEIHRKFDIPKFTFEPKPHWDLMTELNIIDFERAAKITGSRFSILKGAASRLERALVNFMIDMHIATGYEEVTPPHITNDTSLFGTGNLPKFAEDLFKLENSNYYLIPTAEVPVTNIYRNEILKSEILPIKHVAQSQCYRSEAGSAGRDTRGLIRQHQFTKVEIVQFVRPEDSLMAHENLLKSAESILDALKLPYRTIVLCTGDMGFSSSKTYDIEVWLPSYNEYKEISSCSNFLDFQARRANIKFKRDKDSSPEFVHTLNGSGLAVGRTIAAIIENYQNEDGSINIPEVLQNYMGGLKIIK